MRALFDVSFLLAMLDADHMAHGRARVWWAKERENGWASSPIVQNGFLRIISQRSYLSPRSIPDAIVMLRLATLSPEHQFWSDDVSILDASIIDHSRLLGPRQITDIYLLALAVKNGGRFVTLDTGISPAAVRGAEPANLVVVL